ncbi:hypothetical protein BDR03DRAFT_987902 [Suillus americanus]|nr:hypothetical protein BDR03DRAFT_987902 [Suillus americanus]
MRVQTTLSILLNIWCQTVQAELDEVQQQLQAHPTQLRMTLDHQPQDKMSSPTSDGHNVMDFDPGNEGVSSPVLSDASMVSNVPPQPVPIEQPYKFKSKFHPRSGHQTLYQHFEEFGVTFEMQTLPAEEEPWHPFQSHGDFEFSEIALDTALSNNQINWLLNLMACILQGEAQITLKNEAKLCKALDNAAAELTPFLKHKVKVPYKKEERVYEVTGGGISKLGSLCMALLEGTWLWCIAQIYLLRFKTVPKDASEKEKHGYTTLKRVIWHESFVKLLINLDQYSKTGYLYSCYNKILCWLFPVILILSGGYEEQCMMSLIHVCLVPPDKLPVQDISNQAALNIYKHNQTQGEEVLKGLGLCPVTHVLWLIKNSNPHKALSLDDLHTLHGGTGGVHILGELKTVLADLGCEAQDNLEKHNSNKRWDLVKQAFYAALSVLKCQVSPEGYHLLWVICSYLKLDSLIGLDVHTEQTLAMIDVEFLIYDVTLQDYVEYTTTTSSIEGIKTDWNFPKTHLWKHA